MLNGRPISVGCIYFDDLLKKSKSALDEQWSFPLHLNNTRLLQVYLILYNAVNTKYGFFIILCS